MYIVSVEHNLDFLVFTTFTTCKKTEYKQGWKHAKKWIIYAIMRILHNKNHKEIRGCNVEFPNFKLFNITAWFPMPQH